MERAGGAEILYEQIAPVDGILSEWIDGSVLADKLISLIQNETRLQELRRHSCSFLNQDALVHIERILRGEKTEDPFDSGAPTAALESTPLPSNRTLLSSLEKTLQKHPATYKPEYIVSRPQDLEYFKNRASALLIHPSWQERNEGVKLLGLLHAREKVPALLMLFKDRRPASLLKRLLGGDFEQVGFIRRNVIIALMRINEFTPEVEQAILAGLKDPYYEVRSESARAAAFFVRKLSSSRPILSTLLRLLTDPNIDVSVAAAEALGKLGGEHDALPALLGMWDTRLWKLRAAVLRGILHLVERGEISDLAIVETQASKFVLTSTDFAPRFEIKSVYRQLMESVSRKKEKRIVQ
jgi:UDP-N-acetylglucosamine--N-acetylmuramyl-(pentapeptide) pyrophosphoryl-undecaprenol N-acetylglucosamine transferase